ncbi:MAG: polysaccharide biosynthesis/export family protein, partial [Raineya sp.]|nr:polysaccharide biosynthesis/export family protein [Raineya sp.]
KMLLAKMNAEDNYRIKPFDRLVFRLYSNQGQLIQYIGALEGVNPPDPSSGTGNPTIGQQQQQNINSPVNFTAYTVQVDGHVYLPVVGAVYLEGLTARQADSLLSLKYEVLYKKCYVRTQFLNKRVIVFKGAKGEVVPLLNENTTLVEILAQTGGMPNDTRATNIRLIRGDLKNPNVFVIDLSTIEGMRRINLQLQPDDIIYVEPIRKTFLEAISDVSPVISLVTSLTTFVLTIFLISR